MKEDVRRLIGELTETITDAINNSTKISLLMDEFERRGLQAGVEIHPFIRDIWSQPEAAIKEKVEADPAGTSGFSVSDRKFLKSLRIVSPEPNPEPNKQTQPGENP